MSQPRYDYANPLCCLAPGDANGALMSDYMLDAMRSAGCLMHFSVLDLGANARARGYGGGATAKDLDALALGRILLQAPCLAENGIAWQPPNVSPGTDAMLVYPRDALPAGLPQSPYAEAMGLFTPDYALFCLCRPQHIRFYGSECADPSGMILAAAMAAEYVGQVEAGQRLQRAVLSALHDERLPYGLYRPGHTRTACDNAAFTRAVCDHAVNDQALHAPVVDWNNVFKETPAIARLRMKHMSAAGEEVCL